MENTIVSWRATITELIICERKSQINMNKVNVDNLHCEFLTQQSTHLTNNYASEKCHLLCKTCSALFLSRVAIGHLWSVYVPRRFHTGISITINITEEISHKAIHSLDTCVQIAD